MEEQSLHYTDGYMGLAKWLERRGKERVLCVHLYQIQTYVLKKIGA